MLTQISHMGLFQNGNYNVYMILHKCLFSLLQRHSEERVQLVEVTMPMLSTHDDEEDDDEEVEEEDSGVSLEQDV